MPPSEGDQRAAPAIAGGDCDADYRFARGSPSMKPSNLAEPGSQTLLLAAARKTVDDGRHGGDAEMMGEFNDDATRETEERSAGTEAVEYAVGADEAIAGPGDRGRDLHGEARRGRWPSSRPPRKASWRDSPRRSRGVLSGWRSKGPSGRN